MSTNEDSAGRAADDLATLIDANRDAIVSRFVTEVARTHLSPPGLSRSALADHIPRFLDEIVAELARLRASRASRDVVDTSRTARQHGEQRWSLGYDLEALTREYGVLRHCILETARERGVPRLSVDEVDALSRCLSVGVAEAVTAYTRDRDRQLEAERSRLEFLLEVGHRLSSSLDQRATLARLLGTLVPRLADWCVVRLEGESVEDMAVAHASPEMAERIRELYRRFPARPDPGNAYPPVVLTGAPELVASVDPPEPAAPATGDDLGALLRAIGTRSWIVVPLEVQGRTFGALTLAQSESGRHFEAADVALAGEVARRAAAAIDHANLYGESQRERARVEAATRAKDEFVAMVSHELRTPLNAIVGWMHLVRAGGLSESALQHAFEVIERNANAQSQLVADLLDISKALTGTIRLTPSQVDLADIVGMAVEAVRPAADAKRIALTASLDRASALMRGDGDRLQQVVANLLSNALKFTPKGGSVAIRLTRVESDLELEVTDTGQGIESAFLPHVFESFRQANGSTARPHSGLGIGLSIARHIVELHGGSLEAESRGPGFGATFLVRLPVSAVVSTTLGVARVPATTPQRTLPDAERTAGLRVLVVDDDPDARELVTFLCERCGMETRAAGTAADARAALESYTPHVIVSDIGMPDEDGYALIRSIRTLPSEEKRQIPAVALTAFARNEDRTRALTDGFNLHMAKPVEPAALIEAIAELAGRPAPPLGSSRRG